jgi:GDPmannose 4,6-dehydratase
MSSTVLITGVSGFVGPYLARRLIDNGHEVAGFVQRRANHLRPKRLIEMDIISNIQLIEGDITDLTSFLSAIQKTQPDWIFHLAAQSYVPESFRDPLGTFRINCLGTNNILEAVRLKDFKSKIIFAGSSEEYGLQFKDSGHYERMKKEYGTIEPPPKTFPELPISEEGHFRPMSPYATSKVYGDYAFRNYHTTYGLDTVVSRAFNHEGAGRGPNFVTSTIVRQLVSMHLGEEKVMTIGDVQTFRDWSHVEDVVDGYVRMAETAQGGSVYVQGSMRTNSVLSYILYTISALGYAISELITFRDEKKVKDPLRERSVTIGNARFQSCVVDDMLLSGALTFDLHDQGIIIRTDKREFKVQFDSAKFRPSEVPILIANSEKLKKDLGVVPSRPIHEIINDQINYYLDSDRRLNII